jgi:hypothetical protein
MRHQASPRVAVYLSSLERPLQGPNLVVRSKCRREASATSAGDGGGAAAAAADEPFVLEPLGVLPALPFVISALSADLGLERLSFSTSKSYNSTDKKRGQWEAAVDGL